MSWVRITRILDRDEAIFGLAQLRAEWQEAAGEQNLMDVGASVGLLMADVVNALGLSPDEAAQVLGCDVVTDPAQVSL